MLNIIKNKVAELLLDEKSISELENEKIAIKKKFSDLISLNSEELNFYNLLILEIEDLFVSNKDINNITIDPKIYEDDQYQTESALLVIYFDFLENNQNTKNVLFDKTASTLAKFCNEYLIKTMKQPYSMLHYAEEKILLKKLKSLFKDKIFTRKNRFDIYSELLISTMSKTEINSDKYTPLINEFINDLKNKDYNKSYSMSVSFAGDEVKQDFLCKSASEINQKRIIFLDMKKQNIIKCVYEMKKDFISSMIKHNELFEKEKNYTFMIKNIDGDNLFKFIMKEKNKVIFESKIFMFEQLERKSAKMDILKEDLEQSLININGEEFTDYIRESINCKKAHEEKNILEKELKCAEKKITKQPKRL